MAATITRPQAVVSVGVFPAPPPTTSNHDQMDGAAAADGTEPDSSLFVEPELAFEDESPAFIEEEELRSVADESDGESSLLDDEDLDIEDDDSGIPGSTAEACAGSSSEGLVVFSVLLLFLGSGGKPFLLG